MLGNKFRTLKNTIKHNKQTGLNMKKKKKLTNSNNELLNEK